MDNLRKYVIILLIISGLGCDEKVTVLQTETVPLDNSSQVIPLNDSLVKPILYQSIPSFEELTVEESKEKFIAVVLPAILVAKHHLNEDREKILRLSEKEQWNSQDSAIYKKQAERFQANSIQGLLDRMKTHPSSIVLAQAAVESGWGSSRFFQQANNLFGVWSYSPTEPRIAAEYGNVYLREYKDISQSIKDYFEMIGRSRPYRYFRKARSESNKVEYLLPHLKYYSERKMDYVNQLKTIITQNNLKKYDDYRLDPRYFVEQE